MIFHPAAGDVKKFAALDQYDVLPVSTEILSDFITPIQAVRILKNVSSHVFMLESARPDEERGRYTFLGFDPKLSLTLENGTLTVGNVTLKTQNPSAVIREILSHYKSPRFENLPPFTGGFVGYFAFDYFGYAEPKARTQVEDSEGFKDADLMLFDKVIAFDHLKQKIVLIANMSLADPETGYNKAVRELKDLARLLRDGQMKADEPGRLTGPIEPLFDKERFCAMVQKAKHYIREGDISAPFEGSLLNTYRVLRTVNPSPYMFYFSGTDVEVAGASPETLVKLEAGVLHTFPLAGTRPRGAAPEEDKRLEAELLSDEKELAEHDMLVDLGRNDLGKVRRCTRSSVSRTSCTSARSWPEKSAKTKTLSMLLRRCCPPEPFRVRPRSAPAASSGNLKTTSAVSTAEPWATSTLRETSTPASRSALPIRKTGGCSCAAARESSPTPCPKGNSKSASTRQRLR